MALLQQDRLVTIGTPLGKDVLLIESLEGTEGMSQLFRFQLVLVSEKRDIALNALVGQNVTIAIELAERKVRYINGFVSRFSQGDVDSRAAHYYMEVVPWLWFLTRTTDCRIFQKKTIPDIIQQIFKDLGFTDFKVQLQGSFEPREYCVQYRETDFNFISRLAEEEGIFYFFEHENGKHTMVLGNHPGVHQPVPNQARARYAYLLGGNQEVDAISRWHIDQEFRPGKFSLTDYYFQAPSNDLRVSAPTAVKVGNNDKFEVYDYPGYYAKRFDGEDKVGKVLPDGERTAKLGMQGEEAFHKVINGAGACRAFVPGFKFDLIEHRRSDLNGPYVLTQVSHSATNNLGDGEGSTYDNTFTAIPAAVPFRPARTSPKPVVQGAQTAVVVGSAGEEIHTDEHGRVKVQFHWDREGQKDENSSCWIRVGSPWAGKGFGMVHIPRIGQEVIVHFLEGDPDQPIIIGSVYNTEQTPPYPLPGSKVMMGIKSNSTIGGGGYNEFVLDDTKGKEKINIHGQYDMATTIEHDDTQTIHNNRTITVDGTHTETIKKDTTIKITEGPYSFTVVANTATYEVKGAVTQTYHDKQTTTVTADVAETYNATQTTTVKQKILITSTDADIEVNGKTQIKLISGDSSLTLKADGTIILSGKDVTVTGTDKATMAVGNQNVTCDKQQVATGGAAISSSAVGKHEISGAVVKIN